MANTSQQTHGGPHLSRGPAKRAQGLEPEFTAQPRSIADEIALEDPTIDEGLSVDPEDLGSHYLSEAVEQGDVAFEPPAQTEASLFETPAGDEALVGPNFDSDRSIWEQTVDLTLQSADGRDLRAPAFVRSDDFEERGRDAVEDMKTAPVELDPSSIREISLFDREDEPTATDLETDEERFPAHEDERSARIEPAEPSTVWLQGASTRVTRSVLIGVANMLRRLANLLTPAQKRSPPVCKAAPSRADEPSIPHLPIG